MQPYTSLSSVQSYFYPLDSHLSQEAYLASLAKVIQLEEFERTRRIESLIVQEISLLNAESVAKLINEVAHPFFQGPSFLGSKRYTRRLQEKERIRQIKDKAGLLLAIEKSWAESRLIAKLGFPLGKAIEINPLKYLAAQKEEGGWLMRKRAVSVPLSPKLPHIFEETGIACGVKFATEKERLRRLKDSELQKLAREKAGQVSKSIKRRNSLKQEDEERHRRLADATEQELSRERANQVSVKIKRRNSLQLEDAERLRRLSDVREQEVAQKHAKSVAAGVQRFYVETFIGQEKTQFQQNQVDDQTLAELPAQ